jgi:peptide-methionine (S)-S-oxide reductase
MRLLRLLGIAAAFAICWRIAFAVNPTTAPSPAATGPTTQDSKQGSTMKTETATFAAGCFWGTQAMFEKLPGVISTRVGYCGGHAINPTYKLVCTDTTGHAEAVEIVFDPAKITYHQLLEVFFENHDPTTLDRQGPDVGDQYRSAVFYHSPEQEAAVEAEKTRRSKSGDYYRPIVTQIVPATKFYEAEEYHQFYFDKHNETFACHFGNGKRPAGVK